MYAVYVPSIHPFFTVYLYAGLGGVYFKVKKNTFKFQILYLKRDSVHLFAFLTNVKAPELAESLVFIGCPFGWFYWASRNKKNQQKERLQRVKRKT